MPQHYCNPADDDAIATILTHARYHLKNGRIDSFVVRGYPTHDEVEDKAYSQWVAARRPKNWSGTDQNWLNAERHLQSMVRGWICFVLDGSTIIVNDIGAPGELPENERQEVYRMLLQKVITCNRCSEAEVIILMPCLSYLWKCSALLRELHLQEWESDIIHGTFVYFKLLRQSKRREGCS